MTTKSWPRSASFVIGASRLEFWELTFRPVCHPVRQAKSKGRRAKYKSKIQEHKAAELIMILILTPNIEPENESYKQLMAHLSRLPDIQLRVHREQGIERTLTELYLIGNTSSISVDDMKGLPGVERVVRVSEEYRVLGRHRDDDRPSHFDYQGLRFGQDTLHLFAGLCAVDTREHVEMMMRALRE